jgi:hypothetical protein
MAELVHDAQHEFWRPPIALQDGANPAMLEACDSCATEFMVAARFCHVCGAARQTQQASVAVDPRWTRHLEFQNIKRTLGLSTASLIAFSIGLLCLLAVMGVGIVYTVQTFADFQAIQYYRVQWLLAAVAAFLAGILLNRTTNSRP